MSRALEMMWRAQGYAACDVYTGHTLADARFTDYDGVTRWHHFDCNRGGFMMDRSGRRLLSTDELTVDSCFPRTTAVHRRQGP